MPFSKANSTLTILLVEDSPDDVLLFRHALKSTGLDARVSHVLDGGVAIEYLEAAPPYDDRERYPFPDMIMTDLKMPLFDGFELLAWLQARPKCSAIPTIVLSASNHESDVARAYQLGANAYLLKPNTVTDLTRLLQVTHAFWSHCQRPALPRALRCAP
jgi:CheY-like chemotaxis protein